MQQIGENLGTFGIIVVGKLLGEPFNLFPCFFRLYSFMPTKSVWLSIFEARSLWICQRGFCCLFLLQKSRLDRWNDCAVFQPCELLHCLNGYDYCFLISSFKFCIKFTNYMSLTVPPFWTYYRESGRENFIYNMFIIEKLKRKKSISISLFIGFQNIISFWKKKETTA